MRRHWHWCHDRFHWQWFDLECWWRHRDRLLLLLLLSRRRLVLVEEGAQHSRCQGHGLLVRCAIVQASRGAAGFDAVSRLRHGRPGQRRDGLDLALEEVRVRDDGDQPFDEQLLHGGREPRERLLELLDQGRVDGGGRVRRLFDVAVHRHDHFWRQVLVKHRLLLVELVDAEERGQHLLVGGRERGQRIEPWRLGQRCREGRRLFHATTEPFVS
mmetsp:Transcript_10717/g.30625  ORF Transcript_10717/g.30625 Transcript_10717/m.30625 type:complete len:214 (+) Transcript_10717:325-966(+)